MGPEGEGMNGPAILDLAGAVWSTRCRDHFRGVHSDASQGLLCHKEPAQGTQSPLLGALGRKPPTRGFLAFRWFFMA